MRIVAALLLAVGCAPNALVARAHHDLHGYKYVGLVSKDDFGGDEVYAFENTRTGAFAIYVCRKGQPYTDCDRH